MSCATCGRVFVEGDVIFTNTFTDQSWHRSCAQPRATVKRADLFGHVIDTHRTEADLNGWREQQGRLI